MSTAISSPAEVKHRFYKPLSEKEKSWSLYSFGGFIAFLRTFSLQHLVTLVILLIGYGLKVFSTVFSIDTEAIMEIPTGPYGLYHSWLQLDRFGLIVFKYLSGTYWYNNALASFLTVFFLFAATLLWSYLLNEAFRNSNFRFRPGFFSCIFIASPVLAEMLGFLLLGPEVAIAMGLVALSLMASTTAYNTKRSRYYILAILLGSIAFSMYLAVVTLFITGTAILAIIEKDISKKTSKLSFLFLVSFGAIFCISYVIYTCANKVAQLITNTVTNSYITEQSHWGKEPLTKTFSNIANHAFELYHGYGIYYSAFFTLMLAAFLVIQIIRVVKRRTSVLSLLISILIGLSPLMMSIILGSNPSVRTELSYSLAFAFIASFVASFAATKKIGDIAAWICILALAFNQASITNRIFYSEKIRFETTTQLAYEIKSRIDQLDLGAEPTQPVVFIGQPDDACNSSCYPESDLQGLTGRSVFRLTVSAAQGTYVKNHFMSGIGIKYRGSTEKQLSQALTISQKMPRWPAKNSVKVSENIIVVKLS